MDGDGRDEDDDNNSSSNGSFIMMLQSDKAVGGNSSGPRQLNGDGIDTVTPVTAVGPQSIILQDHASSVSSITSSISGIETTGTPLTTKTAQSSKKGIRVVDRRRSEVDEQLARHQIPTLAELARKTNQDIQEMTINKLNLHSIGLLGREQEKATLQHCFDRLMATTAETDEANDNDDAGYHKLKRIRKKQLVFIRGERGVGKTTLAISLQEYTMNITSTSTVIAVGKFDLNSLDEPYSAVGTAFEHLFSLVKGMKQDHSNIDEFKARLLSELGSGVSLLTKLIPGLRDLLLEGTETIPSSSEEELDIDYHAAQERLKYSFQVLVRLLCSYCHPSPILFILDDLQWADSSSLDLIEYLISDVQNQNAFMIIGCYRSNQQDHVSHENSSLENKIQSLEAKAEKRNYEMTDIYLEGFDINNVNKILMTILSIDDEVATWGLARVCFNRTLGNPFFVIQFVTMIEEEELLRYNLGLVKWEWDEVDIERSTMSTENVIDLLKSRIQKLSKEAQLLLRYAACLGSTFKKSTLELIWKEHSSTTALEVGRTSEVATLLGGLEEGHFVESLEANTYRWAHDSIQESALVLGDASDMPGFDFEVGSILRQCLSDKDLEESLFEVVDLLNKGCESGNSAELAAMNLLAAEKAYRISAFKCASVYASRGINALPQETKWSEHRSSSLRLYTLAAEIEVAIGNTRSMESYSLEVLSRDDISTLEKLPCLICRINKLLAIDLDYRKAMESCFDVLKQLQYDLVPVRALLPLQAMLSMKKTVNSAKKKTWLYYRTLGRMQDPRLRAIMAVLSKLAYSSLHAGDMLVNVLCTTRMAQLTTHHGVVEESGFSFTTSAVAVNAVLGDIETATTLAEIGLLLQERAKSMITTSSTYFVAYAVILPWTKPLQSCLSPLSESVMTGMRSGNTVFAHLSLMARHVELPFQIGTPLEQLLSRIPDCMYRMEEFQQQDAVLHLQVYLQMILNLCGRNANETTELRGEAFEVDLFTSKSEMQQCHVNLARLELLVYYGQFERAADLAICVGDKYTKVTAGKAFSMMETFHRGVALYAMARKNNHSTTKEKRTYTKNSKRILKTFDQWIKRGNPNVQHYHCLLAAEQAALDGRHEKAEILYKDAIILAARPGHIHDAALFNERFADFLLARKDSTSNSSERSSEEAQYRLGEAIRYYNEWGATVKVQMLERLLSGLDASI